MGPNKKNKLNENEEYDIDNMTEEEISSRLKEIVSRTPPDEYVIKDGVKYAPKEWYTDDVDEWDKWAKEKNKLNENEEYDIDNMTEEEISARLKEITKNIPEDNPIIIDGVKYAPKSWNTDDLDEWDKWARETFGL